MRSFVSAAALLSTSPIFTTLAIAQSVSFSATSDLTYLTGTQTREITRQTGPPTGPYTTYTSKITITGADNDNEISTVTLTDFSSASSSISGTGTIVSNATESTSGPAGPTNTQPCNNYVELCTRKYSNITVVGAHNSPFVRPGNSGSNQALDVETQLNDGVRFLQAQIQWPVNGTEPHFCHTSCDLLDAGPITDWLGRVKRWVDKHPYDVVTILLGNGNYSTPDQLVPFINKTGIVKYAYEAPYLPMSRRDWPTLEDFIVRGKRVVMFLDYMADQREYPWLLDEFSQVWETPFDPTNRDFPCTVQRPPNLSRKSAKDRLYLMNHNLNAEFNVFGAELLVPAVSLLNETNAVQGRGSLGAAANNCRSKWDHAPNFLNVDYYNFGNYNGSQGSVFEVAARLNNVTWNGDCCGKMGAGAVLRASLTVRMALATVAMSAFWAL